MANDINYVSSVENQLIDAMSQISTSTVKNLNADETIIAQVVECLDISLGKYKLKYQDATFEGFAVNPDIKFENESYVYVLMPQGRFDDRKIILYGEKTDKGASRALPITMITVNGTTSYTISTRSGTETYNATFE